MINSKNAFDVVDGQQRLTTLSLYFLAIFEYLTEKSTEIFHKGPTEKTQQDMIDYKNCVAKCEDINRKLKHPDGHLRLQLLKEDSVQYENYISILNDPPIPERKYWNRMMGYRYKYILSLLKSEFTSVAEIIGFYEKLNNVQILRIKVEDVSDAFSIFSSLNAKGISLSLLDLLKVEFLANVKEDDSTQLQKWSEFMEIFHDDNKEVIIKDATQFLQNNYDTFESKNAASITKTDALKKYKGLFQEKKAAYVDTLTYNGYIFSTILKAERNKITNNLSDNILSLLKLLTRLDASPAYHLLLHVLNLKLSNQLSEGSTINILNALKKFYVRRNIAQKPKASNIRGKILELIRVFDTPNQTINTEDEAIREAEALQNQHVHRIGNLTLTAYNSELSDRSFIEKRDKNSCTIGSSL